MEHRGTPVRKPHTSTADLLTWSENPPTDSASLSSSNRPIRNVQDITIRWDHKVVFGGQVTDEEVESLLKGKPCSDHKLKEMTGSGIFAAEEENDDQEAEAANQTPTNKTGLRMYQQTLTGMSQISFGADESVSPKKPTTIPEVAKQRELSGNLDSAAEAKLKKQLSDANEDAPPDSTEKPLSVAKLREISGNNIFADGKVESRDSTVGSGNLRVVKAALPWFN
ncbi:DNA oxidative demethylase ALKBH2 [Bienertia sinuspersici]